MIETGKIAEALAAFQAEMPVIPKAHTAKVPTKAGGQYSYTYADLADVTAAAAVLLSKNGLAFSCTPRRADYGLELVGHLLHLSGESLEGALPIGGNTPQEMGSAITYARRYLLGAMTGLVTDDDDDGQLAQGDARKKPGQDETAATGGRGVQRTRLNAREAADVPAPMLDKTRKHMHALFSQLNVGEDEQRAGIGTVLNLGGPIASRGDLTEDQGRIVVAALEKRKAAQAPAPAEPDLEDPTTDPAWGGGNGR